MDTNAPEGGMGQGQENSRNSQGGGQGSAPKQPQAPQHDAKGLVGQLEAMLDEYMVKKAPFALPMNVKEIIVKISPYVILIFALMAIPVVLAALGLTALFSPFAMMGGYGRFGVTGLIAGVVSAAALVVELMAVPGLFKRTHAGWRLVYYATLISLVGSILSFNLFSGIIGAIIGWYFLFQVKDMYKN